MDFPKSSGEQATAPIDGKDRCLLCGKPATHRPVLLLVPNRGYDGPPWRFQLGVVVCGDHQKRVPDEILGMMDNLSEAHGAPKVWDHIVHQLKSRNLPEPHRMSTRVDYIPIESDASLYGTAAPSNVQPLASRTGVLPSFLTTASKQPPE